MRDVPEHGRAVPGQMFNEQNGAPLGPAEQLCQPPLALDQRQVAQGAATFVLYARFAPGAAPARRTIGIYGGDAMRLEDARRIAGEWRSQIARGIDPAVIEAERRAAEARERTYPQKITFGELRASGVRDVLVYCRDHRCSHHITISADQWSDCVRLSDIEPDFVCTACVTGIFARTYGR